ncbi:MAG: GNAT family N-acetyltransferase [Rhodobacteraceae bacterium]|nr:GNAT family N-acetyltransferase [Paracoccaceae bacterium]
MEDLSAWAAFVASDRSRFVRGDDTRLNMAWRGFAHVAGMWMLRGFGSFVFAPKDRPNEPVGMTGPWYPVTWPEPELGWSVWTEDAEGKGYAQEAAREARRFAYEDLGWNTAVSFIDPENDRSIALAERLGCTRDDAAATPDFDGKPVLTYRHPAPEALQ